MNTARTHCAIRTRFPATVYLAVTLIIALSQSALSEVLPYRAPRNTEEAVERIEELGGAVRFLKGDDGELEVDFRFATDKLTDEHLKYVNGLKNVAVLRLKRTSVTDGDRRAKRTHFGGLIGA